MKYRHAFHAGNFADVHKHVTLLALLRALQRKDKGLFYLETHAGAGLYASGGGDGHHGAEARGGLERLLPRTARGGRRPRRSRPRQRRRSITSRPCARCARAPAPTSCRARRCSRRSSCSRRTAALCCEIQPAECRALERALAAHPRLRAHCGDGYAAIAAQLPPRERRAADRPAVRGAAGGAGRGAGRGRRRAAPPRQRGDRPLVPDQGRARARAGAAARRGTRSPGASPPSCGCIRATRASA
ncbi:MAG: 23S rRNA (adenine(2030)-N(6))-methyltransferase RlmJ [Steroidobacteraceae bacterium]